VDFDQYQQGIRLFNESRFFDAHEALEDVWRDAPAESKKFLQGLVQVAVAFHHYSTGNRVGMRSVLERAITNLGEPAGHFSQIHKTALLQSLHEWCDAIDSNSPMPRLPKISRTPD
jgi:uncharacterized protein